MIGKARYKNYKKHIVTIRDTRIEDIDNYVRWFTSEIEWMNWDAPWESNDQVNIDDLINKMKDRISRNSISEYKTQQEIDINDEGHVGWVSTYYINKNPKMLAVGIDLPNEHYRGQGIGYEALQVWIKFIFEERNCSSIYLQTWSGNSRMIRLARKLQFVEIERRPGVREVRGENYDALTFKVTREQCFEDHITLQSTLRVEANSTLDMEISLVKSGVNEASIIHEMQIKASKPLLDNTITLKRAQPTSLSLK